MLEALTASWLLFSFQRTVFLHQGSSPAAYYIVFYSPLSRKMVSGWSEISREKSRLHRETPARPEWRTMRDGAVVLSALNLNQTKEQAYD
jgi:hypothetical protein